MSTIIGAEAPPEGVTPNFSHPQDVLKTKNLLTEILCISIVTPLMILRILVRGYVVRSFEREDWVCVLSFILGILYFVLGIMMGNNGGGVNQWEVATEELVKYKKALYADAILYGPAAYFTKVTLLLIFARVFAPYRRTVIFIYVLMGAMLAYYIPVTILKIRICTPISSFWNPDIPRNCLDEEALFITDTVMSVITDASIIAIPIPLIWSLQMAFKEKLRIIALLGAGGVATAASVVRLVLVVHITPENQTISGIRFKLLGVAEVAIGLICACLPVCNILFTRYLRKQPPTTNQYPEYIKSGPRVSRHASKLRQSIEDNPRSTYFEVGSAENVVLSPARTDRSVRITMSDFDFELEHMENRPRAGVEEESDVSSRKPRERDGTQEWRKGELG